jgi:hypothetical protein
VEAVAADFWDQLFTTDADDERLGRRYPGW